jgi:hypothetical protein
MKSLLTAVSPSRRHSIIRLAELSDMMPRFWAYARGVERGGGEGPSIDRGHRHRRARWRVRKPFVKNRGHIQTRLRPQRDGRLRFSDHLQDGRSPVFRGKRIRCRRRVTESLKRSLTRCDCVVHASWVYVSRAIRRAGTRRRKWLGITAAIPSRNALPFWRARSIHLLELFLFSPNVKILRGRWAGLCDMTPDFSRHGDTPDVKGFPVTVGCRGVGRHLRLQGRPRVGPGS